MIQDFALDIKNAFQSLDYRLFDEPDFYLIRKIELYCLNRVKASSIHTHYDIPCRSHQLVHHGQYTRHYVYFHYGVHHDTIDIPVFYCREDCHYHALLPDSIFIPHTSYSIFFILSALATKYFGLYTVEETTRLFQIPASTLYRWDRRYHAYLRIFIFLRDRYRMNFFIHIIYNYHELIQDLFIINLHTLFQYDRTLSNHDP